MAEREQPSTFPDTLNAWVASSLGRATAFAYSLLGDPAAADDVVHDCYCRLLQKAAVYNLPRDGTKLLFKAITNACIDRRRHPPAWVRFSDLETKPNGRGEFVIDRKAVEPVQALMQKELAQAVEAGLRRLPVNQRAALELKSLGWSLQEIAETLAISPTNVGVLIHRARQGIAHHLGRLLENA